MPELTQEEKRILDECRSDSFWYRALPLGLAFGSLTQAGIQAGKIAAAGRMGTVVRVFAAGTLGYVIGKGSYAGTCKQKFLEQAPNSNISRVLRGEPPLPVPDAQPDPEAGQFYVSLAPGAQIAETFPQPQQQSPLPFGQQFGHQPQHEQPIDRERQEGTLSYDQLRQQHRHRQSQPVAPPPPPPPQQPQQRPQTNDPGYFTIPDPPLPPASPAARKSGNKYGDEGFE